MTNATAEVIKNLSDGEIYTSQEIANLLDCSVDEIDRVLIDPSISKTYGDGSGVLYIMDIKYDTIVDGDGFRNTVYLAGCNIHCEGCHNSQSWDIINGIPVTVNELFEKLSNSDNNVTFSGGEASLQAKVLTKLTKMLTDKTIWLYTGHLLEDLQQDPTVSELLKYIDVVVDGPFVLKNRTVDIPFVGSTNQRIMRKIGDGCYRKD